jgi:hypothetical protein
MAAMVLITIVTAFVSPDRYGDSLRRKKQQPEHVARVSPNSR